jgi:hypothetical protein
MVKNFSFENFITELIDLYDFCFALFGNRTAIVVFRSFFYSEISSIRHR